MGIPVDIVPGMFRLIAEMLSLFLRIRIVLFSVGVLRRRIRFLFPGYSFIKSDLFHDFVSIQRMELLINR